MLIWKFFRMVWTTHAVAEAPAPLWTIPPERFVDLHPRLTNLTPRMMQTLGQGTTIYTINIMNIITKKMKSSGSGEASGQRWRGADCKIHWFNPGHTKSNQGHPSRTTSITRQRLDWHVVYTQSLALYTL